MHGPHIAGVQGFNVTRIVNAPGTATRILPLVSAAVGAAPWLVALPKHADALSETTVSVTTSLAISDWTLPPANQFPFEIYCFPDKTVSCRRGEPHGTYRHPTASPWRR
jgi:hypothetical protein